MSEQPPSDPTFLHRFRADRRQLIHAGGLGLASAGLLGAIPQVAGQQGATPAATPGAGPAATPDAELLPTPSAIPETSLRIVRSLHPDYGGEPTRGTDLRMHVQEANLLDFSPTAQRQDFQILVSLYDPLVWIDSVTMAPKPWLAESWQWGDDGLSLTFILRPDVSFHDGTPLTAEDVRFSFQAYRDDYESAMTHFFALITDIIVVDQQTVRITFAEPDGAFLYNGASQPIFSSAQYAAQWETRPVGERSLAGFDWQANPPIGSGPWAYAETRNNEIVLERHDAYWQEAPHFDHLVLIGEDDRQARLDAWKSGDVDIVFPVGASDLDGLWDQEGTLYGAQAPVAMFAAFNFANPANVTADMVADSALRQAMTLAIDRDRFAQEIFHGFIDETRAGTITQPWAHDPTSSNPARNIDEANRLLDEAGWVDMDGDGTREHPTGNRLDLWCIVSSQERPELLGLLELLKEDFAKIGAQLTVQHLEPAEFDDRWVENRMYDMIAYTLIQYPAFAEFDLYGTAWDIRANTMGWNPGGYSNPVVDGAIEEYFGAWTPEGMTAALSKLQIAANDDLFGLWFGFPNDLALARPDIQGFQPHMYFQTWNTRFLWRGDYVEPTPDQAGDTATPESSPEVSPVASPQAMPVE